MVDTKTYMEKILQLFNMHNAQLVSTPFPIHIKLSSKHYPSTKVEKTQISLLPYTSAVGSLMFSMVCTRLDIAQEVRIVNCYMENTGIEHWTTVKWILRYLRGTYDDFIYYSRISLQVNEYVDAYFGGDGDKRNFTTGYIFSLVGGIKVANSGDVVYY